MSENRPKPSLHEKITWYNQIINSLNGLLGSTTRFIIAIIILLSIFIGIYHYFNGDPIPPKPPQPNPDIKQLYSYLSCLDEGLMTMESNTQDENLKIRIKNFKEYKQTAVDLPAFQMYENSKEVLNKHEKEKLNSYIMTIKNDLESNAKKFSIQLPDCK